MEHQPPPGGRELATTTIVAAATATGRAGLAVVRVSGPAVPAIARGLVGELPVPRRAQRARFRDADGATLDEGLALYFPAPHSYTGEDVLELHGHGGAVLPAQLVARACALGAVRAGPGEFTQRAFLNGKLDLAQAEAVADLIDAASAEAARAALRTLGGEFSERIEALRSGVRALRVEVEAAIDFSEEALPALAPEVLAARLAALREALETLRARAQQGRLLTEGLTVVIAGPANAGKSTLFNRLTGEEAAIVTPIPGTTRDVLRERIRVGALSVLLMDTAGLRASEDPIEREGMRRTERALAEADHVLFVVDAAIDPGAEAAGAASLPAGRTTLVMNKSDLAAGPVSVPALPAVRISALSGEGIEALQQRLLEVAGAVTPGGDALSARARHVEALERTAHHLDQASAQLARQGLEIVAEELRRAHEALGEILGAENADALLGHIFSSFCIGK